MTWASLSCLTTTECVAGELVGHAHPLLLGADILYSTPVGGADIRAIREWKRRGGLWCSSTDVSFIACQYTVLLHLILLLLLTSPHCPVLSLLLRTRMRSGIMRWLLQPQLRERARTHTHTQECHGVEEEQNDPALARKRDCAMCSNRGAKGERERLCMWRFITCTCG